MRRRLPCLVLPKALGISSATARTDLLKALAILSDTTVRRSAVDQEDLKPYCKSEKCPYFSRRSSILFFLSFSKTLLTTERRLTGQYFLAVDLSPTFLNTGKKRTSNNLENKTLPGTYWRVQLVCIKIQAHSSLEPPLEYNWDQMPLMNQGSLWLF